MKPFSFFTFCVFISSVAPSQNPFVKQILSVDPSTLVFDGTMGEYVSHAISHNERKDRFWNKIQRK